MPVRFASATRRVTSWRFDSRSRRDARVAQAGMNADANDTQTFRLLLSGDRLSVCHLDADHPIPAWASGEGLWALLRRERELTVVCATDRVPPDARQKPGWRALTVDVILDFSETGILAALTALLAQAKVSVFALSTYETDVLLVQQDVLDLAIEALRTAGHDVVD